MKWAITIWLTNMYIMSYTTRPCLSRSSFQEKNRFTMRGRYQGSGGNRISLGAFQIPQNSVTVSLGGQQLIEGTHYTVDYNLGAVTIIDDAILNSGQQVKIDFENNALFGFNSAICLPRGWIIGSAINSLLEVR